jgi:hypothetical protein
MPRRLPAFAAARRPSHAAVIVATSLAVAACGGESAVYTNEETNQLAAGAARAKTWTPSDREPVTLALEMPTAVAQGGVLPIRIRIHNGTTRPLAIGFGRTQGFDVIVAQTGVRADSGAVWSPLKLYSTSRDATLTDPLPAGRDTTFDIQWPTTDDLGHTVRPGRYRVRAMVAAELLQTRQIWTAWQPIDVTSKR